MEIYGDVYFLINFSMDFICLYICLRVLKTAVFFRRVAAAAFIGGAFSLLLLCLELSHFFSLALTVAAGIVMCRVALPSTPKAKGFITVFLVYTAVSFFMAGGLTFIYNAANRYVKPSTLSGGTGLIFPAALLCAVASIVLSSLSKRSLTAQKCRIRLVFGSSVLELVGLLDSGNLLTEPISGMPVVILNRNASKKLDPSGKFSPEELGKIDGLLNKVRIIPVTHRGKSHLLTAIIPELIEIDGVAKRCLIALSTHEEFGNTDALVPSCLIF